MSQPQVNTTGQAQPQRVMIDRPIICSTCRIKFESTVNYRLHITTEYHQYNQQRKMAQLDPVSEEIFEQKKAQMISADMSAMTHQHWKCEPCNKTFKSTLQLEEHQKSKKHKRSEKAYKMANPEASQSSFFKSINTSSHAAASTTTNQNNTSQNILSEADLQEKLDDPTALHDLQSQEEKVVTKTTLDSLKVCLFSNKEFDTIEENLNHMRKKYGFFILDIDCLVNLKGLLTYLAERIQVGQLCLTCSKGFKSPQAAQMHMIDMGHCFMNANDESEYEEFYDFSKTYQDHPLAIKGTEEKKQKDDGEASDESWEDADFESGDEDMSDEESDIKEEEGKDDGQINTTEKVSSKQEIGNNEEQKSQISSIQGKPYKQRRKRKEGKTRQEAFLGLDIKKAELLETGEIKLGNGKIIGHRDYKYIYKQRYAQPDTREAVLINRLAIEQRKATALMEGMKLDVSLFDTKFKHSNVQDYKHLENKKQRKELDVGMRHNKMQFHWRDPNMQ